MGTGYGWGAQASLFDAFITSNYSLNKIIGFVFSSFFEDELESYCFSLHIKMCLATDSYTIRRRSFNNLHSIRRLANHSGRARYLDTDVHKRICPCLPDFARNGLKVIFLFITFSIFLQCIYWFINISISFGINYNF